MKHLSVYINLLVWWGGCTFVLYFYGRLSPPKIQGCQIDQQIQSWSKDQLQDRIANKGMAWPNYRRFSFPS